MVREGWTDWEQIPGFVCLFFNFPYLMGWLIEKPAILSHQEAHTKNAPRKTQSLQTKAWDKGWSSRTQSFLVIHVLP